eukprot:1158-Heterococcus_DN1.PRE.2
MGNCCSDSTAADAAHLTEEERNEQRERVRAAAEARAARYGILMFYACIDFRLVATRHAVASRE